ncbi:MAG: hypothetical protein IPP48_16105 [Chitinophagaceae bacterium]|nr:hypothetical protein [Chitinophagaceae bacterium]
MGLRYRFSNKFQLSTNIAIEQDKGNWGWAFINDSVITNKPLIARRDVKKNFTLLSAQYSFTPRMNLSVIMRHNWSLLNNTNFYNLKNDGYWTETTFLQNQNLNFNTFNVDLFYTWDFLLGSRITLGWKNALGNNVKLNPYSNRTYLKNLGKSIDNPHSNEITLKIVYFLDHLKLKHK